MNNGLLYRKIESTELEEVNKFNNVGVNSWMREFFSPLMKKSILYGCFNGNNELIGTEGYIGYKLNYNNLEILSHRSERTLVSDNYRGKGIFKTLIKHCDEYAINNRSCLVWGGTLALKPFSNAGFNTYVGFRTYLFLQIQNPFIAILKSFSKANFTWNPLKIIKAYKSRDLKTIVELIAFFSNFVSIFKISSKRDLYSIEIKENDLNVNEISSLNNKVFSNANIYSININQDLLDWLNNIGKKYRYYSFYHEEQLIGYLITEEDSESSVLRVVDFCFLGVMWVEPIFRKFKKIIKKTGFSNLLIVLNLKNNLQKEYSRELSRMGGYRYGNVGSFVVKNYDNGLHQFNEIGQLYLTDIWLALQEE